MPQIPSYESQVGIKTGDTPSMGLQAVNASNRAQSGAVNAIENAEDALIRVRDFREQLEANAYAFQALQEQRDLADQDIEFDYTKYEKAIDQIGQSASKNISGRLAKDEFLYQFQRQATAAKFSIKDMFRTKQLASAKATLDYQGQQIIDAYGGMDEAGKITAVSNYRQQMEDAVKIGMYDTATANSKFAEFKTKLVKGSVDYGILNNPEVTLAQLQKGDDGEFPGLTQTERVNFIKEAEARLDKNDKIAKKVKITEYNNNYREAMLQAFDGNLSKKSIESLYISDKINDAQRSKLENYVFYNMPTVDEDDLSVYNQIAEMQANGEDPEEINNLIIDNATNNKLKNSSAKQLIGKTYTDFRSRRDELISVNIKEMKAVATEFFRDELDEPDQAKIASALYTFNRRVNDENASGERITLIAQEIITDTIRKEYPEINQIETINRVKDMMGIKNTEAQELPPPKNNQELSPFKEYPDAFKENGVWKVVVDGKKYRVEE